MNDYIGPYSPKYYKKRLYNQQYRAANKEKLAEDRKKYYQKNKEQIDEKNRRYRKKHPEKVTQWNENYRLKHPYKLVERKHWYDEFLENQILKNERKKY